MKKFLIGLGMLTSLALWSGEYLTSLQKVENFIGKTYTGVAASEAQKQLKQIADKDAPEAGKIEELKKAFPEAFAAPVSATKPAATGSSWSSMLKCLNTTVQENGWKLKALQGMAALSRAANAGKVEAQMQMGMLYFRGIGVSRNYQTAFEWFKKSADNGYATAQNLLGACYQFGAGTEINPQQAFAYYKKAADQNDPQANDNLGECYYYGFGTERDYAKAVACYQRAIKLGFNGSLANLATCYRHGRGVEKNEAKAKELFQRAALSGNETAQKILDDWDNSKTDEKP